MTTAPLPRSVPETQGVSSAAITALVDALQAADEIELHSLMIARHGQVIAEGWWQPYSQDQLHLLYSLSKSFTSTAAGLAQREGLLSLDDRLIDVFDDLAEYAVDDRMRRMTLKHAVRMATGHREDALPRAYAADGDDLVRGFLSIPPDEEPGSIFCYNNAATFMVGAAVQKVTGQTLSQYLRPRLFEPLGIDAWSWQTDRQGREIGFSGLHLTTESIMKFGQLIIQGGQWEGQQLLDRSWLAEATSKQTDNDEVNADSGPDWRQGYGYQFWMARHGFRGDGAYGQFCLVLPEHDLVMVTTSATGNLQGILDRVWEVLLPGLSEDQLPADTAAQQALSDQLATLRLAPVGSPDWRPTPLPDVERPLGFTGNPLRVTTIERTSEDRLRITVDHEPAGPELPAAPLTFDCGIGSWVPGTIMIEGRLPSRAGSVEKGPAELVYAGSAEQTEDGSTVAEIAFVQTPHRLRIRRDADGVVETGWLTEPLGPPYPEALATRAQP